MCIDVYYTSIGQLFPLSISDILGHIKTIVETWHSLGVYLNMPSHVLKEIRVDNPHSVVACKEQMISRWVSYHSLASPHCLWSLVKALKGIGENRVAKEIEDKYGNSCNNCTRLVLLQIYICAMQVQNSAFKRNLLNPSILTKSQMMTLFSPLQESLAITGLSLPLCSPSLQRMLRRSRKYFLKLTGLCTCSESGVQGMRQHMVSFV